MKFQKSDGKIFTDNDGRAVIDLLRPRMTVCVTCLLAINIVVFVMTEYYPANRHSVWKLFTLWPDFKQFWRLFTFQFLHIGLLHIFLNMFVVVQGGTVLERLWGWKKFLAFYLLSAATSASIYELMVIVFDGPALKGAGASGGVYAILVALMTIWPNIRLKALCIYVPFWIVLIAVIVIDNHMLRGLHCVGEIIHLAALAVGFIAVKLFKLGICCK